MVEPAQLVQSEERVQQVLRVQLERLVEQEELDSLEIQEEPGEAGGRALQEELVQPVLRGQLGGPAQQVRQGEPAQSVLQEEMG